MHGNRFAISRSQRVVGAALVLALIPALVAVANRSGAAARTIPLVGVFRDIANFHGPTCPSAIGVCSSFTSTGVLSGTGVVVVDGFLPPPSPPGISTAHTTIRTRLGTLTCNDIAAFDLAPGEHPFVDQCLITGGSGFYAGATGYIQENGTFDFPSNRGEARYAGKVILP